MNRPEILLLPLLMIADYYLTILGAVLRERSYGDHFKTGTYEMNPEHQKAIDSKSLLNLRAIFHIGINSAILFVISYYFVGSYAFVYQITLGFYLTLFAYILGLHFSNIPSFLYASKNKDSFSGTVSISHTYNLHSSLYSNLVVLVPIIFVYAFSPSFYTLGAALAIIYKIGLNAFWLWNHKSAKQK